MVARVGDLPPTHARRLALHRGILDGAMENGRAWALTPGRGAATRLQPDSLVPRGQASTLGSRSKSAWTALGVQESPSGAAICSAPGHYRVVVPGVAGVHGTFYARHSDQVRRLDDEPTPA